MKKYDVLLFDVDGAIVGPNAMVNKNVEGGEEQW